MEMLQQPDKIAFLYPNDHQVRYVRMNQPHPARITPSWYGDSVGRYDGDTLVLDTVGGKTDRPCAMVDWSGTPYTQALHVVACAAMAGRAPAPHVIAQGVDQRKI